MGAIDADLLRVYGIDLMTDLGTPRLDWRRLGELVDHLPRDSALNRSRFGDSVIDWTTETELLAAAVDRLAAANYQRGGGKGSKPKPVKRPEYRKPRTAAQTDRIKKRLAKHAERRNRMKEATHGS